MKQTRPERLARSAQLRSLFANRTRTLVPLVLVLTACKAVGPDYTVPADAMINHPLANAPLIETGAPVSQQPLPPDWWRLYDDPVLDQLVESALQSNTDLRVAAANLARSRAAVDVASAQGGFSGSASATLDHAQEAGEQYLLFSKVPVANEGNLGLNVSYEFDLFGKLQRGVEAAQADSEAAKAASDLARVSVVSQVVEAYVEACSAGDELTVAQRLLDLQKQRVALSARLRSAGRGSQPDVTRDQTQADTLAADVPRFLGRRRVAEAQLAALLARPASDLPAAVATCDTLPALSQPIPVGDGAALLKRRPDVREAERQLAAATARIGVAVGEMYPSVEIGASTGTTGLLGDLFGPATNRWSVGPLISWTFPANGQRARVRAAEAATGGALAHFDGVVLNALRETQSSLATYAADTQRAEALQTAYRSATKAADETHQLYMAGRESFVADLDAARTLAAMNAQLEAAMGQVALDQVSLFRALGGGWETTEAASLPMPVTGNSQKTAVD
ncbi:efflux transporter outer membrane subunit [Paraburkholderia sp. USG1]|uniref:efflux transporter outer membrane subunit n=1 Tax=Paraburkholderia sp. USG1 TaxID=2952268 RepID=UPI0028569979|nr:efflux transporter outer membrane subunit [Paraburkholderia sp. USG1]MDR8398363.1 efflux transporter outer membrane subunit [Paraburkholderia sp. USG1]